MATNNAVNNGLSGATGTGNFVGSVSPTFTGTPVIPSPFSLGGTSMTSSAANLNLLSGASQTLVQQVYNQTGAYASGTTIVPIDDTIPQITEGDQYLTQAITPKSATNILVIEAVLNLSSSATQNTIVASLFQDATANALGSNWQTSVVGGAPFQICLRHIMVAGTTSSTTFRIRAGGGAAGTTGFNGASGGRLLGGVSASSLRITEYKP